MDLHSQSIVVSTDENRVFVRHDPKLADILDFILGQAKRLVGAKNGAFYLINETESLVKYGKTENTSTSDLISKHIFKHRKNLLLKKGSTLKTKEIVLGESYIACFLGQDTGILDLGVFILEGINHFDNFSTQDFELISYYASNLSLLLRDSISSETNEDVYTSLITSILLLLDNSNIHQKNNRLEYQTEEII